MRVKLDGIAETLLITLYTRAIDAKSDKPILNDQKSLAIMQQIDYDFDKFKNAKGSFYGTMSRIAVMDRKVKEFISKNPRCQIISIGCGLDTRFERVDNGLITWVNVDFPEVMEIRKAFFEENSRVTDIGCSALDPAWTQQVNSTGEPLLIVSEGVLMYLTEAEVKRLLGILTDHFAEFTAHLDLCSTAMIQEGEHHDTVKFMNADFNFGVTDGHEIVDLNPKLKQVELINFTDEMKRFKIGLMRLCLPFIKKYNNRLGIYEYHR